LKSLSTGQHFRLFVKQGQLQEKPTPGVFSFYGLSASATVPWF
ncbi:type I-F CRISPR-associated endoribonuclease Cas6/Csy4, partial [Serratia marcescens]